LKKSPLTPATVAESETAFSIEVTRCRPVTVPFARIGWSEYSPPGRGAVSTCRTTGPWAVNWICFEYVTPGISASDPARAKGAAVAAKPASMAPMRTLRSTTPLHSSGTPEQA